MRSVVNNPNQAENKREQSEGEEQYSLGIRDGPYGLAGERCCSVSYESGGEHQEEANADHNRVLRYHGSSRILSLRGGVGMSTVVTSP